MHCSLFSSLSAHPRSRVGVMTKPTRGTTRRRVGEARGRALDRHGIFAPTHLHQRAVRSAVHFTPLSSARDPRHGFLLAASCSGGRPLGPQGRWQHHRCRHRHRCCARRMRALLNGSGRRRFHPEVRRRHAEGRGAQWQWAGPAGAEHRSRPAGLRRGSALRAPSAPACVHGAGRSGRMVRRRREVGLAAAVHPPPHDFAIANATRKGNLRRSPSARSKPRRT